MELPLRAALLDWLRSDTGLNAQLNAVTEEVPSHTALPWLAITASASTDWSCKGIAGRQVRVAFELHCRADEANAAADLVSAIETRIASFPSNHSGFQVCVVRFLRARAEQRANTLRAVLLEYQFHVLTA